MNGAGIPAIELTNAAAGLNGRTVWRDVNLTVEPGEFVALLGPNGVGKTILLKVILGLVPLRQGEIHVFGKAPTDARGQVGYLPQARVFDPSIRLRGVDLVRLGLEGTRWGFRLPGFRGSGSKREEDRRIREVLQVVDADDYAERPIGELSGGEQQRILIGQAIVHHPSLLLLDEPLASLDYPTQAAITALIGRICREEGISVLMVTHDVNPILGYADKVAYMARGGLVAGRPEEVVTTEKLTALYGARVEVHYTSDDRLIVVGQAEGGLPPMGGHVHEAEHECCDLR
jgi:zinc/manganese transport system ATP-binding protein